MTSIDGKDAGILINVHFVPAMHMFQLLGACNFDVQGSPIWRPACHSI